MATRRAFVISRDRLTAYHRHGTALLDPFPFAADEEGRARFDRYLERFPNDVTCVIADVVEEEFREDTVPHVFGLDRRALLRARASRAFRDARHVYAAKLGREPDGRRDDRLLFSAITRSEVLAPWLAATARHSVPLVGICSPALLAGSMLRAIGARGEHVLVVSRHSGGGLRQTCFRRGRLRLSRLAILPDPHPGPDLDSDSGPDLDSGLGPGLGPDPGPDLDSGLGPDPDRGPGLGPDLDSGPGLDPGPHSDLDRFGAAVLAEVERTRRYLNSLDTRGVEDRLDVHVLAHGETLEALRRVTSRDAADGPGAGYTAVDLAGVARRLGMRGWGGESTADRLFVHVALRRPAPNQYATREETRDFATLRARSLLKVASTGLVAGGCLFGGVALLEGALLNGHADSLAMLATHYEDRYREARARLPAAPAEPTGIERAVSVVNVLRGRRADPLRLLALISDALEGFPRVRVEGVAWRAGDAPGATVEPSGRDAGDAGDAAGPSPDADARPPGPNGWFQTARVSARVESFEGDYRSAIDTVQRFADALAARPGVESVRVLSLPLDLGSGQTLTGDARTVGGTAAFEVEVALRTAVPGVGET